MNTAYSASYRLARRADRPMLGTHVVGTEAIRVIASLVEEGFTKGQIATALGHKCPVLHWRAGDRVTLRTLYGLRILRRQWLTNGRPK